MSRKINSFKRNRLAISVSAVLAFGSASLQAGTNALNLDIKSQSAGTALLDLGEKAGVQILIPPELGKNITLSTIQGEFTLSNALSHMLEGTGLSYKFSSDNVVVISEEEISEGKGKSENKEHDDVEEIVVIGSHIVTDPGKLTRQMTTFTREDIEQSGRLTLDEFLRTMPQNLNSANSNGMGLTLGNKLGRDATYGSGHNVFGASGVNLRGLGDQYTLILVDGRRPAKSGQFGELVDISNIPINQVDRIEVLFDGASAIYGPDAIGGVVNIITRRDYEGTDLRVDYSATTGGGGERLSVSLGHTFDLDEKGKMSVSLNHIQTGAIDAAERDYDIRVGQAPDLIPSNPGNLRGRPDYFSNYPEVTIKPLYYVLKDNSGAVIDQTAAYELIDGWFGPQSVQLPMPDGWEAITHAQLPGISKGQTPLTLGDMVNHENGADMYVPMKGFDLVPKDETTSLHLNWRGDITDDLSMSLAGYYSRTDKLVNVDNSIRELTLNPGHKFNPFLSEVSVSYIDYLPDQNQTIEVDKYGLFGDVDFQISDDWGMTASFNLDTSDSYSITKNAARYLGFKAGGNGAGWACEDLDGDGVPDEPVDMMTYMCANGVLAEWREYNLNPFDKWLGFATEQEYQNYVLFGDYTTSTLTKSQDFGLRINGVLATLPAGDIRTSINLSHNSSNTHSQSDNPYTAINVSDIYLSDYDRDIVQRTTGVGVELSAPIIGENNAMTGIAGLTMSLSGRADQTINNDDPSLSLSAGLNWQVNDWLTVRMNHNKSVQAPYGNYAAGEVLPRYYEEYTRDEFGNITGSLPTLLIAGAKPNLKSEESTGNSIGFIIRPTGILDGIDIQLNLTESTLENRLGTGQVGDLSLEHYQSAEYLTRYSGLSQVHFVDGEYIMVDGLKIDYTDVPVNVALQPVIPGTDLYILNDTRVMNMGDASNRNLDVQVGYNFDTDLGDFRLSWRHQYSDYSKQVTYFVDENGNELKKTIDVVGHVDNTTKVGFVGQPLPAHKGLFSLNWGYSGLSATLNASYQSSTSIIELGQGHFVNGQPSRFDIVKRETIPMQSISLNIAYALGESTLFDVPKWMEPTVLTLNLGNIWQKDMERKLTVLSLVDGAEDEHEYNEDSIKLNPYQLDARGQTFNLGVHFTF